MRTLRSRSRGFSLIEALIAMGVFMVGVIGFMGALVSARGSTAWARRDMGATAIAEDLTAQIGLWRYDDVRLATNASDPCYSDPGDANLALTLPGTAGYNAFLSCAHQEPDLTLSSNQFWGVATPSFPVTIDPSTGTVKDSDNYIRLYVVREEDEKYDSTTTTWASQAVTPNKGCRKRIWVLVAYKDGGIGRRVVTYQTKYNPACTSSR